VAGGAQPTDKLMGALPAIFDGNRERADDFIEELKAYIHLNQRAMTLYIQRLALTLTLIKGTNCSHMDQGHGSILRHPHSDR
jgi:hypothetical protein